MKRRSLEKRRYEFKKGDRVYMGRRLGVVTEEGPVQSVVRWDDGEPANTQGKQVVSNEWICRSRSDR